MTAARAQERIGFRATLERGGKTATGIEVPPDVVEALGSHKRPPVQVTIGSHTYRSTIAVMGGRYMIGVSSENRQKAGVTAGDVMDVELELDTTPREVEVPRDLANALRREKTARAKFDKLSYSNKRRIVMSIEGAKAAETRQRRIAKAMDELKSD